MLRFPVSNQKQAELTERMQRLALVEGEIDESFFKASSPGGQKANKTLSGVSLLHLPTQIRIRCQRERSQGINRFIARRLLVEELEARRRGMTRHSAKAERLHEEKERKNRSSKKQPSANGQGGSRSGHAAESVGVFDLARAMAAYYLRPLT
jgi:protein subunit release factor B